jgi:hypothetical protein
MAGYLLMADRFETLGIVVASTHRKEHATTPDQQLGPIMQSAKRIKQTW